MSPFAVRVVLAVVASTAGVLILALKAAGFTTNGVAAGSLAAAWQSSIGIANGGVVPAGSSFSALQAAGMSGDILTLILPVLLAIGAVAGVGASLWKAWF